MRRILILLFCLLVFTPAWAQLQVNIPLTGTLGIAQGGTGASTAAGALTNLGAAAAGASISINGVACSLGSSCAIAATSSMPGILWADQTGAHHDGITDDSGVLNQDIATLGAQGGGTVCLTPGETYAISNTVVLGNGTQTANSTVNGVMLVGCNSGGPSYANPSINSASLKWTGTSGGTMVEFLGPSFANGIRGVYLNANGLAATAIKNIQDSNAHFEDLLIESWTGTAIVQTTQCPSFTGVGAGWNTWVNVQVLAPVGSTANGMSFDGCTGSNSDTTQSTYTNMLIGYSGGPGTWGLYFGFADNNVFSDFGVLPAGGVYSQGGDDAVFVQQSGSYSAFPYANTFINWGFSPNPVVGPGGSGGNNFLNFSGTFNAQGNYFWGINGTTIEFSGRGVSVSCGPQAPSASFQVVNGIVTHC